MSQPSQWSPELVAAAELLLAAVQLAARRRPENNPTLEKAKQILPPRLVSLRPTWHARSNCLSFGQFIVKQFRQPAPNQQKILAAFQEEDWIERIDDALPGTAGIDPKQRLHEAIAALNRHQANRLLRFMGDGTGRGIRWRHSFDAVGETRSSKTNAAKRDK